MNTYQVTERLPYSAQQMFDLVASVEDYAEFMPLCERSVITSRRTLDDGGEEIVAILKVAHKKSGLSDQFESRVHVDRTAMTITAVSETGPVRRLENRWTFRDLDDGRSETDFFIAYQMRNWPLQMLMSTMSARIFDRIAAAFRQRAVNVYG